MMIPDKYKWLLNEKHPQILVEAVKLYGIKETQGKDSTPAIMQWAAELGAKKLGITYQDDSVAWCGLFMAICAKRAGQSVPAIAVRAISWLTFGNAVKEAMLGDVLVFTRAVGGHVGLYVGEDDDAYHVLGGNQSDRVCITRILKNRLTGIRRSVFIKSQPTNIRKIKLEKLGKISDNEA